MSVYGGFRSRVSRSVLAIAGASALVAGVLLSGTASAEPASHLCSDQYIPVSWSEGAPNELTMYAELCTPIGQPIKGLQFLVHGVTYDHHYWNPASGFSDNSYSAYANSRGYATLSVDRIGYGLSSRPSAIQINYENQAWQLHQAIAFARDGRLGSTFTKVAYVGHSSGTALAWSEAKYKDVDALVATGVAHGFAPLGLLPHATDLLQPAFLDPKFQSEGLDPGYLTTISGVRASLFHSQDIDPRIAKYDEEIKDVYSPTELVTALGAIYGQESIDVQEPVLAVLGEYDKLICGPLATDCSSATGVRAHEESYYSAAANFDSFVLPNSGHSINFAPNAQAWFEHANDWLDENL